MTTASLDIPQDRLADFCTRWKITELALFGSVLRDDFGPDSDIDILVTFEQGARITLLRFAAAQRELSTLLDRSVDLVMRRAVEASARQSRSAHILESAEVVYAA
ncbi:MAG: nucleotidyltransferase domain-containing protein [Planctomycetes bacterium]|nr:nucleotidyltransferase domain-containing protein [Planctomycetota bacterium]